MTALDGTYINSSVNTNTHTNNAPTPMQSGDVDAQNTTASTGALVQPVAGQAPVQPPAAQHTQLSRDQIIAATALCLRDAGYDGTTIRKIARRLDCAVGSIYRYFRDKRDLLYAVAQQKLDSMAQLAESGAPLELCLRKYYEKATQSGEEYHLMFWLAQDGDEKSHAMTVPTIVERIIDGWGALLGDRARAEHCWATLHGHIVLGTEEQQVLLTIRQLVGRGSTATITPQHTAPAVNNSTEPHTENQPAASDDVTLL